MRTLILLVFGVLFSLGCMGTINSLTGLDLDVAMGEDAVFPSDFPVKEPTDAKLEKAMSMSMKAPGSSINMPEGVDHEIDKDLTYRMDMIVYTSTDQTAIDTLLPGMHDEVTANGFTKVKLEDGVTVYEKGDTQFLLGSGDKDDLLFMRLNPVEEEVVAPQ